MQAIFLGGFQADQNLDFAGLNRVFSELPIKAVIVPQQLLKQQCFHDFIGAETQRWRCSPRRVYCGDYASL
jgi:hypothetical protein